MLAANVCLNGIVKEQSIFIEVVLRFLNCVSGFGAHGPVGGCLVFDFVLVLVGGSGGLFPGVFYFGKFADVHLLGLISAGFREVISCSSCFLRKRKFSEGGVSLFGVKRLSQGGQA